LNGYELSSKCYKKAKVAFELKAKVELKVKVASFASLAFARRRAKVARLEQRLQGVEQRLQG
jgi:hypothetical protein